MSRIERVLALDVFQGIMIRVQNELISCQLIQKKGRDKSKKVLRWWAVDYSSKVHEFGSN